MSLILNDRIGLNDKRSVKKKHPNTLWARTKVLGGYGLHKAPNGVSVLGETVFTTENMVTIGGVQQAMEMIFGVSGPITIPTLYTDSGIGLPDTTYADNTVETPDGTRTMPYPHGYNCLLFGIGVTGSAENSTTELAVSYREYSINVNMTSSDGETITGIMVPFRYTGSALSDAEALKYFGKKEMDDGNVGYYLKRFETDPIIYHLWKSGDDEEGETSVENSEVWSSTRTSGVETYTEIVLQLSEDDLKEYFTVNGDIDETRFNTVALFTGWYNAAEGDYENVRLFSKLHIPVENLSLSKDLDIIYRVYGS